MNDYDFGDNPFRLPIKPKVPKRPYPFEQPEQPKPTEKAFGEEKEWEEDDFDF